MKIANNFMYLWDTRFFPQASTMFFHETKSFCINNVYDDDMAQKIEIWNRLIPYYMKGDILQLVHYRYHDVITDFLVTQFPYRLDINISIKPTETTSTEASENIKRANSYFKRIQEQVETDFFIFEWEYDEDRISLYLPTKFDFFTAKMLL